MPDENFVQSDNFCFPPNYFFIFTCFIIFGVICKSLNGVFREQTYSKPLPTPALGCVCMVSCVLGFANINICVVKLKGGGPPAPQGWGVTPIHCI